MKVLSCSLAADAVCSLIESTDREVVVVVVQETLAIKVTLSFFLSLSLKEGDLNCITIVD